MEELTKLKNLLKFGEDKNYYADKEYITNSMLGMLNKSPQHLQRYFDGHREESPALNFGSAFHTMILEPHRMDDEVVVFEGKTRRGKAWDKFSMENSDKTIISITEWNMINGMANRISNNNTALDFINSSDKEVVEVWMNGGNNDIHCKGKADMVVLDEDKGKILIDLKTTADASLDAFRRSAWKYGYDRQAAFYMDGFGATELWFVVIEKSSPYRIGIYKAGEQFIEEGRKKNTELLDTYHRYFISKEYKVEDFYFNGEL